MDSIRGLVRSSICPSEGTIPAKAQQQVVGKNGNTYSLCEPVNPPSRWSRFKASLSCLPWKAEPGWLSKARERVENYSDFMATTNRQTLIGLEKALSSTYNAVIARKAFQAAKLNEDTPLSLRKAAKAYNEAERWAAPARSRSEEQITNFLQAGIGPAATPPFSDMPAGTQAFLRLVFKDQCRKTSSYNEGTLREATLEQVEDKVLALHNELAAFPGMDKDKLSDILRDVSQRADLSTERKVRLARDKIGVEQQITTFLEAGIGPTAIPPFSDKPAGTQAFLRLVFKDQYRKTSSYNQGTLQEASLKQVEDEVLALYNELAAFPGMDLDKLSDILREVSERADVNQWMALASEAVIARLPENVKGFLKFVYKDQSVAFALDYYKELQSAFAATDERPGLTEEQLGEFMGAVMKSRGSEKDRLKRAQDHVQAGMMVMESLTLKPDQKKLLLIDIGKERCIDAVQLEQYEIVARTMVSEMLSPAPNFSKVEEDFQICCDKLTKHGNAPWHAWKLEHGGDLGLRAYAECAALAARGVDPLSAKDLVHRLSKDPKMMQMPQPLDQETRDRLQVLIAAFAERGGSTKEAAAQQAHDIVQKLPT